MSYQGLQAEVVSFKGHNGDTGEAYYSRPSRAGRFPGVLVIHHLPGWDEWIMEVTRKFAHHGFAAIAKAAEQAKACESRGEAEDAKEWRHIEDAMKIIRGPHQS